MEECADGRWSGRTGHCECIQRHVKWTMTVGKLMMVRVKY